MHPETHRTEVGTAGQDGCPNMVPTKHHPLLSAPISRLQTYPPPPVPVSCTRPEQEQQHVGHRAGCTALGIHVTRASDTHRLGSNGYTTGYPVAHKDASDWLAHPGDNVDIRNVQEGMAVPQSLGTSVQKKWGKVAKEGAKDIRSLTRVAKCEALLFPFHTIRV